jgi:hypothetical protein
LPNPKFKVVGPDAGRGAGATVALVVPGVTDHPVADGGAVLCPTVA